MTRGQLSLVIGGAGLFAAWYYARRQSNQLAGILAALPQNPAPLSSRQIGNGFLDAITGGTGLAPIAVDPRTGEMHAPYGTDLLLPALDPNDPSIVQPPYYDWGLPPGQQPQNTDLLAGARATMDDDFDWFDQGVG